MSNNQTIKIHGWTARFISNVHMYTHQLTFENANQTFDIPCEELPKETCSGIWLDHSKLPKDKYIEIMDIVAYLSDITGIQFKVYTEGRNNTVILPKKMPPKKWWQKAFSI
ncbi:MAG: hypothetical protein MJH10_20065 [Epibacterium sp.]|nr:hypothetical protein [Epibacterium sp.]NQX75773.1 hypothetical protein [Epibacterium sp.]